MRGTPSAIRLLALATIVGLGAGCARSGSGDGSPYGGNPGGAISCDELANYVMETMTMGNMRAFDPLLAELMRCSQLTPDQAREVLGNYMQSRAEVDRVLANWDI